VIVATTTRKKKTDSPDVILMSGILIAQEPIDTLRAKKKSLKLG